MDIVFFLFTFILNQNLIYLNDALLLLKKKNKNIPIVNQKTFDENIRTT